MSYKTYGIDIDANPRFRVFKVRVTSVAGQTYPHNFLDIIIEELTYLYNKSYKAKLDTYLLELYKYFLLNCISSNLDKVINNNATVSRAIYSVRMSCSPLEAGLLQKQRITTTR